MSACVTEVKSGDLSSVVDGQNAVMLTPAATCRADKSTCSPMDKDALPPAAGVHLQDRG